MMPNGSGAGTVYVVGAGPGDEGLITVKGMEALERADCLVYDYLANPRLLNHCPRHCERIYAGKMAGQKSLCQEQINGLLIERAAQGKTVVRLKGGDPFVFGRGGEEALELARHEIPFIIVPGVTAALAAAAYAGIPLTHRGMSASTVLVTGHEDSAKKEGRVDWESIAGNTGTLAVYMGIKNLSRIVTSLLSGGCLADTPAALIRWATLNRQRTLTGTLANIAEKADAEGFAPPSILIVGEVVNLREKLRWFDTRPLYGRRILLTRGRKQASELVRGLKEQGAEVIEFPLIEIQPMDDQEKLSRAIDAITSFSWIVFTSVNGVKVFFERVLKTGLDARILAGVRVAAIGSATNARILKYGIRTDLMPTEFTTEALLDAFRSSSDGVRGRRILIPGSDIAGELLPESLEQLGAEVMAIPVYRNRAPAYMTDEVDAAFKEKLDLVTFTSSSTVDHLVSLLKACHRERYLEEVRGACIGPATAKTARQHGIRIALESGVHTIPGLIRAICDYAMNEAKQ
jgi:uroporphyrinogen III methyltransferase/synthase